MQDLWDQGKNLALGSLLPKGLRLKSGIVIGKPGASVEALGRICERLATIDAAGAPRYFTENPGVHDLIACLDVLEFVEKDANMLKALAAGLKSPGVLVVTGSAMSKLWSSHDVHARRYRRYEKGGLEKLVIAQGLKVERASYFFQGAAPAVWAVRKLRDFLGKSGPAPDPATEQVTWTTTLRDRIFERVIRREAAILQERDLDSGTFVVCIARKN